MARVGNITSSEIVALTTNGKAKDTFGKPFYTYIKQCNWERNLGRSLDTNTTSRPLSWGKLMEIFYFQTMGLIHYTPLMDEPKQHPTIESWWGSPDAINNNLKCVSELKCPQTMQSFCQLVEPLMQGMTGINAMYIIRGEHPDGEKYYWQCVSNAIITGNTNAELIIFCPYKSQLDDVRQLAQDMPTDQLYQYYWIGNATDKELPYLIDGGKYKNINSIYFEIPQADIDFLTNRVNEAVKMLVQ